MGLNCLCILSSWYLKHTLRSHRLPELDFMGLFCSEPHWCQWRKHQSVHEWVKFGLLKYKRGIHGSREVRIFSHLSGRWAQAVGSSCPRHSQGLLSWITQCIKKNKQIERGILKLLWIDNVHGLCRVWAFTYWVKLMSVSNITMWAEPCELSYNLGNIHRCFTEWGRWGWTEKLFWETVCDFIGQLSEVHVSETEVLVFYMLQVIQV